MGWPKCLLWCCPSDDEPLLSQENVSGRTTRVGSVDNDINSLNEEHREKLQKLHEDFKGFLHQHTVSTSISSSPIVYWQQYLNSFDYFTNKYREIVEEYLSSRSISMTDYPESEFRITDHTSGSVVRMCLGDLITREKEQAQQDGAQWLPSSPSFSINGAGTQPHTSALHRRSTMPMNISPDAGSHPRKLTVSNLALHDEQTTTLPPMAFSQGTGTGTDAGIVSIGFGSSSGSSSS